MNSGKSSFSSIFSSYFSSWTLVAVTAVVTIVSLSFLIAGAANDVEAARVSIRFTARVSVVAFLLAFTASAAWQFWPGAFTRWQRSNRRYFGLSFALSHFIHLAAILSLGIIAPAELAALTQPASVILGGLAYVLLALMTATSFDRTARLIGPRAWTLLHTTGSYYFSLIFANSFISRALTMPEYILPAVAVVAALGLRIAARLRRSRRELVATG